MVNAVLDQLARAQLRAGEFVRTAGSLGRRLAGRRKRCPGPGSRRNIDGYIAPGARELRAG